MESGYKQLRALAAKWLNGKRDFQEGISILESAKFKPAVVSMLKKHGPNGPSSAERLEYHMRTFIKVWFDKSLGEDTDMELGVVQGERLHTETERLELMGDAILEAKKSMPQQVAELVTNYRRAYIARDKAFKALADMPSDNNEATVAKRKQLSDEMERQTDIMDKLYPQYSHWCDTGELPAEEPEQEEVKNHRRVEDDLDKLESLTTEQLRVLRHSLTTKITRAKNMLLYQRETTCEEENPMPEGVTRVKYESKIARLNEELAKVRLEYARRA